MNDIYKNIEECNPNKKQIILIVFDYMIAGMLSKKKLNPIITELFTRELFTYLFTIIYSSCFYHTILFRCSEK